MIRGRGKCEGDLPADRPEDHRRGPEVVREVNHVRAKGPLTASDLPENDRHVRRLADIVVHAPELRMFGVEPGVGSEVDRDLGNVANRQAVPWGRFDVHGQRLDLVASDYGGKRGECHRLAGEMHARLRYGRIAQIMDSGLHEFLTEHIDRSLVLGSAIATLYLR